MARTAPPLIDARPSTAMPALRRPSRRAGGGVTTRILVLFLGVESKRNDASERDTALRWLADPRTSTSHCPPLPCQTFPWSVADMGD